MDIKQGQYEIRISRHAFLRAFQRSIYPDVIESTLKGGNVEEFGKSFIRLRKKFKRGSVICIGEKISQDKIVIKTIEWG
ncbi:MAG: hypothetical protein HYY37_06540 [Candidatus Aenigmarchaeota archaeon]|nr:hypothetical protein [Candidatus Aenigmarchaeota archaeon]